MLSQGNTTDPLPGRFCPPPSRSAWARGAGFHLGVAGRGGGGWGRRDGAASWLCFGNPWMPASRGQPQLPESPSPRLRRADADATRCWALHQALGEVTLEFPGRTWGPLVTPAPKHMTSYSPFPPITAPRPQHSPWSYGVSPECPRPLAENPVHRPLRVALHTCSPWRTQVQFEAVGDADK